MKNKKKSYLPVAVCFLVAFAFWTAAIQVVDVQPIGPLGSTIGFAGFNSFFHNFTGVHLSLYMLTDRLSLIPLIIVMSFALAGLAQWICRKKLLKVDPTLLALGGFYIVVFIAYSSFEIAAVNYRPVLIDGILEASYPSSTTMLVLCVMPTAAVQLSQYMSSPSQKGIVSLFFSVYTAFMVIARVVSGVHWITDIIGGILLSGGLVTMYLFVCSFFRK